MASYDKVKLVVVGDSGVGKTSLVHLLCHNEPVKEPYWTIGCSVELHEYKAGTPQERTFFIEMWDVGGFSAHQNSRAIFYNSVNGIVLVHDLTNRKSQQNLRKWFSEVINRDSKLDKEEDELDPERMVGSNVPVLIIGTKLDLVDGSGSNFKKSIIAEELYADEINLDSSHVRHIEPGTGNAVKLSRFFDKVIEQKFYPHREQNFCMGMERRRNNNSSSRLFSFD